MNWSIITTITGTVLTMLTVILTYRKFKHEMNKELYTRRLNEVYAPLYGLIVKQETFRDLFKNTDGSKLDFEDSPILTGGIYSTEIVNTQNIVDVYENCKDKGLARPQLIYLINQYVVLKLHFLSYMNRGLENLSEEHRVLLNEVSEMKKKVGCELVKEIQNGYEETIHFLGLDDKYFIKNILKNK